MAHRGSAPARGACCRRASGALSIYSSRRARGFRRNTVRDHEVDLTCEYFGEMPCRAATSRVVGDDAVAPEALCQLQLCRADVDAKQHARHRLTRNEDTGISR